MPALSSKHFLNSCFLVCPYIVFSLSFLAFVTPKTALSSSPDLMKCSKVRPGCEAIVARIGHGGFTGDELDNFDEFQKSCLGNGCLEYEWQRVGREIKENQEPRQLIFTEEEATSIVNVYKPKSLFLISNIRLEFKEGEIHAFGQSAIPLLPSELKVVFARDFEKDIFFKVTTASAGTRPLPKMFKRFIEDWFNRVLVKYPSDYGSDISLLEPHDSYLEVEGRFKKGLVDAVLKSESIKKYKQNRPFWVRGNRKKDEYTVM